MLIAEARLAPCCWHQGKTRRFQLDRYRYRTVARWLASAATPAARIAIVREYANTWDDSILLNETPSREGDPRPESHTGYHTRDPVQSE